MCLCTEIRTLVQSRYCWLRLILHWEYKDPGNIDDSGWTLCCPHQTIWIICTQGGCYYCHRQKVWGLATRRATSSHLTIYNIFDINIVNRERRWTHWSSEELVLRQTTPVCNDPHLMWCGLKVEFLYWTEVGNSTADGSESVNGFLSVEMNAYVLYSQQFYLLFHPVTTLWMLSLHSYGRAGLMRIMSCHVIPCHVMSCHAVLCYTIQV